MRASRRLKGDELLVTSLGSTILRKHLDDVPLWRGDHVAVKQLVEDFARYLYLSRLARPEVLVQAIRDGVALFTWETDTFAFADSRDEGAGRYPGLRGGQVVSLSAESAGLLVRPDVARKQMDAEVPASGSTEGGVTGEGATPPGSAPQMVSGGDSTGAAADQIVRTVTENSRTLKFTNHGFEAE